MIKNKTLFNGLPEGDKVEMPIADGPFGSYFGMFAEKFAVQWMVNFTKKTTNRYWVYCYAGRRINPHLFICLVPKQVYTKSKLMDIRKSPACYNTWAFLLLYL
jgi:hypothetical protein